MSCLIIGLLISTLSLSHMTDERTCTGNVVCIIPSLSSPVYLVCDA